MKTPGGSPGVRGEAVIHIEKTAARSRIARRARET